MTEKTAVHTPTKEEYDRLMKVYVKLGLLKEYRLLPYNDLLPYTGKDGSIMSEEFVKERCYTIITVDEAIAKLGLYERGQRVLVSYDEKTWMEKIYITFIDGANYPYICVDNGYEDRFNKGDVFGINQWKYIKPLEPTTLELTMKDIEDKYGCKVKIVK